MYSSDWIPIFSTVLALLAATIGSSWTLATYIAKQFALVKSTIFDKLDKTEGSIIDKLEYHERHDDQRFLAMGNDIWAIKIRNAAIDGQVRGAQISGQIKEENK